jgi:hypothetical protein
MGTRGAFGVRVDGVDKVGYNQFDSYPSGQGVEVLKFVRAFVASPKFGAEVVALAKALILVDDKKKPTKAQQAALKEWSNLDVSERSLTDWYCLLHKTHGDIAKTLLCGYVVDHLSFLTDSLFCEWAYIVNFDERTLEVYSGFQKEPHEKGRYAATKPNRDDYYPVGLVKAYSFDALPTDKRFIKECDPPEEDE